MNKKAQLNVLLNPRYLTIISFAILGYFVAPNIGIDRTFGMLIGIGLSFVLGRYMGI